jgi:hypothetical protein
VAASRQSRGDDEAIGRQLRRYPARTNVLALTRWWWATSELRMSMRPLTTSSGRPVTLSPYLYGLYSPPKQRWWPLFAWLGAGGGLRTDVARAIAAIRRGTVNAKTLCILGH